MPKLFLIIDQNQQLYQLIKEINLDLQYEILNGKDKIQEIIDEIISNSNDYLVLTNKTKHNFDSKRCITINKPIKASKLFEMINLIFLKNKYLVTSNISVGGYNLDLNSRTISSGDKNLKLTERELDLIIYLSDSKTERSSFDIRKDVWGHAENVETHTVETHIYRLRKKIIDTFNDQNFLIYKKNGYKIL